jgi:amino-acid N-acetyltransferase
MISSRAQRTITVKAATAQDAATISAVLTANREDRGLLQKSAVSVARSIGDFFVARDEAGRVVGCAALHRDSAKLAEVAAVAVVPQCQWQGIGRKLMRTCEQRGKEERVRTLWLATIKPDYFSRYGFRPMSRWELPAQVLLRKLGQVFQQPAGRWVGVLFGRYTFMQKG